METLEVIGKGVSSIASNNVLLVILVGAGVYVLYFTPLGEIARKLIGDVLNPIGTIDNVVSSVEKGATDGLGNFADELIHGKFSFNSWVKAMPITWIVDGIL